MAMPPLPAPDAARLLVVFALFAAAGLALAMRGGRTAGGGQAGSGGGPRGPGARRKAPSYLLLNLLALGALLSPPAWRLFPLLLLLCGLAGAREIAAALARRPSGRARIALLGLALLYLPAGLLALAWLAQAPLGGRQVAFLYLCVAAHDAFAQVIGDRWGRRRLAPRFSPGKTVAGAAGGLAAGGLMGLALLPSAGAALLGLALGGAALAGDLLVSAVKRAAGLKDFGRLLGPQGGILDRIDGLLLAALLALLAERTAP